MFVDLWVCGVCCILMFIFGFVVYTDFCLWVCVCVDFWVCSVC